MEYRGLNIVPDGTYGYHEVKPSGKGSVPLQLRGRYTHTTHAKKDIDTYLGSKKAPQNGKDNSTS